jgi:hypothetical protein
MSDEYKTEVRTIDYECTDITARVSFYNEDDTIELHDEAGQLLSLAPKDLIPLGNMLLAIAERLRLEWEARNAAEAVAIANKANP